jgi:hypothetical protein
MYQSIPLHGLPKYIKIGFLVWKYLYHLATLLHVRLFHKCKMKYRFGVRSVKSFRTAKGELILKAFCTTDCLPGLPDFSWHKIYQINKKYTKWPQNITNGWKIDQMDIKYTTIFHCKTLPNLPKWDLWFENMPSGNPAIALR